MAYIALGVILLVLLVLAVRLFLKASPAVLARGLRYSAASLLGAGAGYMLFTGRMGPALMLGAGTLMALGRWPPRIPGFGFPGSMRGDWGRPSGGQASQVETEYLRMQLDHDTGDMAGTVLKGAFRGSRLADLSFAQALELLAECRVHDNQAAALLETWLDRAHGADWREKAGAGGAGSAAPPRAGRMTPDEARAVLGVAADATPEQIREAHRALMKKVHPDQGGSTYLASKINEAKDVLLGH